MKRILLLLLCFALAAVTAGCLSSVRKTEEKKEETAEEITEEKKEATRAEMLLEEMSLQEKIEQMLMPSFRYISWSEDDYEPMTQLSDAADQELRDHNFAGVILFAQNIASAEQTVTLIRDMKQANAEGDHIPLLIAADQEGGYVRRLTFGTFTCGSMALAATGDVNEAQNMAALMADEMAVLGFNTDFAPVADVNSNPLNPIIGVRSFGDDADTVIRFCRSWMQGMQTRNIITAVKHFPGHGDTETDSHSDLPSITAGYDEIQMTHIRPFAELCDKADMIMSAHIQFPQLDDTTFTMADGSESYIPATISEKILSGILRDELGYEGVICTDAMAMDAISENFSAAEASARAINAGANLILIPIREDMPTEEYMAALNDLISDLCARAEAGEIRMDRINESVLRILKLKEKRGILDAELPQDMEAMISEAGSLVGSREHHEREFETAEKAVTLLKNEDQILPLAPEETAVVLIPFYSLFNSVSFASSLLKDAGRLENDMIPVYYGGMDSDEVIAAVSEYDADAVIAVSTIYDLQDFSDADILAPALSVLADYGMKTILLSGHLPYEFSLYDDAQAHLACYQGSGMEEIPVYDGRDNPGYGPNIPAALAVIYNHAEPQGRLPVNVPRAADEVDAIFSDEIYYRRGEGLGY